MTLANLTTGLKANITTVLGLNAERWQSMGIASSSSVVILRRGPGGIIHCRIGSTEFALARTAAELVNIQVN